jgi:hypothetical protein
MALFNKVFLDKDVGVNRLRSWWSPFYEKPGRLLWFQLGNCSGSSIRQ